jgi:hypothetical protein
LNELGAFVSTIKDRDKSKITYQHGVASLDKDVIIEASKRILNPGPDKLTPREWWIVLANPQNILPSNRAQWAWDREQMDHNAGFQRESRSEYFAKHVHVIEKSAYDQLKRERDEALRVFEEREGHESDTHGVYAIKYVMDRESQATQLQQELEALREENEKLKAIEANWNIENGHRVMELKTQLRKCVETLGKIAVFVGYDPYHVGAQDYDNSSSKLLTEICEEMSNQASQTLEEIGKK